MFTGGIGTVQAFHSVLIRARVDGTLDRIAFTEGQDVKLGDLLAAIDPRPYQATLEQALAKKAADDGEARQRPAATWPLYRPRARASSPPASRWTRSRPPSPSAPPTIAGRRRRDRRRAAQPGASPRSPRRSTAGSACAWSIPATSCMPAIQRGIVTITQLHPISVAVHPAAGHPAARCRTRWPRGKLPVQAYRRDDKTPLSQGDAADARQRDRPDHRHDQAEGDVPEHRRRLWPGQFVNVRLLLDTRRNASTVPSAAVQHGPNGLYRLCGQARSDGDAAVRRDRPG